MRQDGTPALRQTGMCRGAARASQVPGPSSSYMPWSEHPAGDTPFPRPDDTYAQGYCGLQVPQDPRPPGSLEVSGPHAPWPVAHAYASPMPFLGSAARLLPAQAGSPLGRAGFAPAGRPTKFHEVIASSFPFDPHCLVALYCLSPPSMVSRRAARGRRAGGWGDAAAARGKRGFIFLSPQPSRIVSHDRGRIHCFLGRHGLLGAQGRVLSSGVARSTSLP